MINPVQLVPVGSELVDNRLAARHVMAARPLTRAYRRASLTVTRPGRCLVSALRLIVVDKMIVIAEFSNSIGNAV
jgi:hypothetical protein